MGRLKLGTFTVVSLLALVLVPLLALGLTAGYWLTPGGNGATRVFVTAAALILLALAGRWAGRKWPNVFSDGPETRSPKLTTKRAGALLALLALWAGALVWCLYSETPGVNAGRVLAAFTVWYLVLVGAIFLLENHWIKRDALRR